MYYKARIAILPILATIFVAGGAMAADERGGGNPPLLSERPLPPPIETPDSNKIPARALDAPDSGTELASQQATAPVRRYAPFRDHRRFPEKNNAQEDGRAASDSKKEESLPAKTNAKETPGSPALTESAVGGETGAPAESPPPLPPPPEPPTPEAVENYRAKLEQRLLERYNNLPAYAGKVYQVRIVAAKPLEVSLDGRFIQAEFDQLVYDIWGKRLPALEKEYFVVTFGAGGVEQVRSDPSIRVGLDMEKTYSERAPLAADPFRNVKDYEAFKDEPKTKMPGWWRPDFPELR